MILALFLEKTVRNLLCSQPDPNCSNELMRCHLPNDPSGISSKDLFIPYTLGDGSFLTTIKMMVMMTGTHPRVMNSVLWKMQH